MNINFFKLVELDRLYFLNEHVLRSNGGTMFYWSRQWIVVFEDRSFNLGVG